MTNRFSPSGRNVHAFRAALSLVVALLLYDFTVFVPAFAAGGEAQHQQHDHRRTDQGACRKTRAGRPCSTLRFVLRKDEPGRVFHHPRRDRRHLRVIGQRLASMPSMIPGGLHASG